MDNHNLMIIIMFFSIGFQLVAALTALWLIRLSGVKAAWTLVASALFVMAMRRALMLYYLLQRGYNPDMLYEILGLFISVLMLAGIMLIKPLFERINRQKEELVRHQQELEEINAKLEERVKAEVEANIDKDRMMMMQAREAAMGEMIASIAHQWKQPLNSLGLTVQQIKYGSQDKSLTDAELDSAMSQAMDLIKHMSQTIEDFRNFLNPGKLRKKFSLEGEVRRAISFISALCLKKEIFIDLEVIEDSDIDGPGNELVQVLMNLFQNSAEAFEEKAVSGRKIVVRVLKNNGKALLTVADNAGGIAPEIMGRLFDAYSTTRQNGTGIGLHMSKMIINKSFNGKITVASNESGAEFSIEI